MNEWQAPRGRDSVTVTGHGLCPHLVAGAWHPVDVQSGLNEWRRERGGKVALRTQGRPGTAQFLPPGGARGPGAGALRLLVLFSLRLSLNTRRGLGLFSSTEGFWRQPGSEGRSTPKAGLLQQQTRHWPGPPCLVAPEGASSPSWDLDAPGQGPPWGRWVLAAGGYGWS